MVRKAIYLIVFLPIILLSSCASMYTSKSHYEEIDQFLDNGQNQSALEALQSSKDSSYKEKDRVLFYLEEGMLYRYAGQYEKSNESLTLAEYAIEDLLTKSISKGLQSGILNDNALDYTGEDYEDIYINIFKSLNYLQLNRVEEALVEIRRVNHKLNVLEDKYKEYVEQVNQDEGVDIPSADFNFHNDALARYLGIIAYRLEGSFDDSRIEKEYFDEAYRLQNSIYNFPTPALPTLDMDETVINIISYSGLGPEKVADTLMVSTGSNSIFLGASTDDDYDSSSYLGFNSIAHTGFSDGISLKLQFPRLVESFDPVSYVEVLVNNENYGRLDLIESVDNVAIETFKVKQPLIVGKTVVRAVAKAIIAEASESLVEDEFGSGWGLLTGLAGDIFMQVSENADLRVSRYFPSKVRGKEISITPGVYDISLIYYDEYMNVLFREDFVNFSVKERGLNLLESHLLR